MTVASSQKVGRVIDLSWAPLPQPVGGGAVVALALEDGSLAFADTSQAVEHSSRKQRMQAFKHLLGGSWPYPQVMLKPNSSPAPGVQPAAAPPLGSTSSLTAIMDQ